MRLSVQAIIGRLKRLSVRERVALAAASAFAVIAAWYCKLIVTGEIQPVLSTWLLIFLAVMLGFATYLRSSAGKRSPVTNIANTCDVLTTTVVLVCLVAFGKEVRFGFTAFELWCFAAAGAIVVYYFLFRQALAANLAVNVLLVVAYLPLVTHLWTADQNTESFAFWFVLFLAGILTLYNPLRDRDFLATVYAVRGLASVVAVLLLLLRLELR